MVVAIVKIMVSTGICFDLLILYESSKTHTSCILGMLFNHDFTLGVETCTSGRCACAPPTPGPTPSPTPCTAKALKVEITTDNYPLETSWSLTNKCTEEVIGRIDQGGYNNAQTKMSETYCAAAAEYEFTINDSYGDGICCGYGTGSYTVTFDGTPVLSGGDFAYTETKGWGSCDGGPQPAPPPITSPPTTSPPTTSPPTTSPPTTSPPTNQVTTLPVSST